MNDPKELDILVNAARFGSPAERDQARSLVRQQAEASGIHLASIRSLYSAIAAGRVDGFTVPAMNVRGMSYELCRAIFRSARRNDVGAFVIEIARSEMGYTDQRPDELAVVALAAALREGYRGPVFLQGDHYQIQPNASAGIEGEMTAIRALIDESLRAGFYNLDIDASKTVDLSRSTPEEQQAVNGSTTASLTRYIREHQPLEVAVGGEIGEIGASSVSTPDDLRGFMTVFGREIGPVAGLGKVAVQTGTSHGGTPNPDGSVAEANVDFNAIMKLTKISREYGLAGVVQHGASTLPADAFWRFPEAGCLEIHLSTEFQNIIWQHPAMPKALLGEMETFVRERFTDDRKPGMTDAQFLYKNRKRVWGPYKRRLSELPEDVRNTVSAGLEEKVDSLFLQLGVANTRSTVEPYV